MNQGLINRHNNGLISESSKTKKDPKELLLTSGYSDEAAYQQYLQRVLATTSNKGLHMQDDMGRSSQPPAALLPPCPQGKQDSGSPLAPHEKIVLPRGTDHVFQLDPEISPSTREAWDKHPDWAILRASIIAGATAAARYGYSWAETAHVKHLTSIWEHNRRGDACGREAEASTSLDGSAHRYG